MLLLILAVLWGIVLIPPVVRSRSEARRLRSLVTYRRRLGVLAPPVASRPAGAARPLSASRAHVARIAAPSAASPLPSDGAAPAGRRRAGSRHLRLRRHRRRLAVLLVAMTATLALGLLPALHPIWVLHLGLDLAFAAYAAWLRQAHRSSRARLAKVHYLPAPPANEAAVSTQAPLRRSASS